MEKRRGRGRESGDSDDRAAAFGALFPEGSINRVQVHGTAAHGGVDPCHHKCGGPDGASWPLRSLMRLVATAWVRSRSAAAAIALARTSSYSESAPSRRRSVYAKRHRKDADPSSGSGAESSAFSAPDLD